MFCFNKKWAKYTGAMLFSLLTKTLETYWLSNGEMFISFKNFFAKKIFSCYRFVIQYRYSFKNRWEFKTIAKTYWQNILYPSIVYVFQNFPFFNEIKESPCMASYSQYKLNTWCNIKRIEKSFVLQNQVYVDPVLSLKVIAFRGNNIFC